MGEKPRPPPSVTDRHTRCCPLAPRRVRAPALVCPARRHTRALPHDHPRPWKPTRLATGRQPSLRPSPVWSAFTNLPCPRARAALVPGWPTRGRSLHDGTHNPRIYPRQPPLPHPTATAAAPPPGPGPGPMQLRRRPWPARRPPGRVPYLRTPPCLRGPDGTRLSPRLPGGRGPGQRQRAPQPHDLAPPVADGRQIEVLAQGPPCGTVPSWQLTLPWPARSGATATPAMTPPRSPAMPFSAPLPESAPPPTLSLPKTGGAGWWLSRWKQAAVGAPRRSTLCAPSRTPKPGAPPVAAAHDRWGVHPPMGRPPRHRHPARIRGVLPWPPSPPPLTPSMGPALVSRSGGGNPLHRSPLPQPTPPNTGGVAVSRAETCAGGKKKNKQINK